MRGKDYMTDRINRTEGKIQRSFMASNLIFRLLIIAVVLFLGKMALDYGVMKSFYYVDEATLDKYIYENQYFIAKDQVRGLISEETANILMDSIKVNARRDYIRRKG